jgi:hypothetical protein
MPHFNGGQTATYTKARTDNKKRLINYLSTSTESCDIYNDPVFIAERSCMSAPILRIQSSIAYEDFNKMKKRL